MAIEEDCGVVKRSKKIGESREVQELRSGGSKRLEVLFP